MEVFIRRPLIEETIPSREAADMDTILYYKVEEKDEVIMYQIDFETPMAVHFIGIGGISMSGLAEILIREGFSVSGSDTKQTALTKRLESLGEIGRAHV